MMSFTTSMCGMTKSDGQPRNPSPITASLHVKTHSMNTTKADSPLENCKRPLI